MCLRTQLRKTSVWDNHQYHNISSKTTGESLEEMYNKSIKLISGSFLTEKEKKEISTRTNKATYLLVEQSVALTELKRKGLLTEFEHSDIEKMIASFYDFQGAAERIKDFSISPSIWFFLVRCLYLFLLHSYLLLW